MEPKEVMDALLGFFVLFVWLAGSACCHGYWQKDEPDEGLLFFEAIFWPLTLPVSLARKVGFWLRG